MGVRGRPRIAADTAMMIAYLATERDGAQGAVAFRLKGSSIRPHEDAIREEYPGPRVCCHKWQSSRTEPAVERGERPFAPSSSRH